MVKNVKIYFSQLIDCGEGIKKGKDGVELR